MDGASDPIGGSVWLTAKAGTVADFRNLVTTQTDQADWPGAASVEGNIPIYDGESVRALAADDAPRKALMDEWARAFLSGPGVIAIRNAIEHAGVVDRTTRLFDALIAEEKETGAGGGDHFAKPGANDRVWNSAQKHCVRDPENFAQYYASDVIAMASEAWLGPGYQLTAQVNRVNPGGAAQTPHRDYHLGFMSIDDAVAFPSHVHGVSPMLTLQGAVAHCDMPVESGPTMLLPYSQAFHEGYVAFHRAEFQQVFRDHHVQLPLKAGDAMFFNPALMHGAGPNRSPDIFRMANLLQVGSAFGRSIESVDRTLMARTLYPTLLRAAKEGTMTIREIRNVVAATAEGYAYPTNLDTDPPAAGSLGPKTQASLMLEALEAGHSVEAFKATLAVAEERRQS